MSLTELESEPRALRLRHARQVLRCEAGALLGVADRLGDDFERVYRCLAFCQGRVAVTGIGKSADVAQKIVGTLNSTGTRSYVLDATKSMHGDLGMIHPDDVALVLSHSGESEELLRLLGPLRQIASAIAGITGNANGTLARTANAAIVYGPVIEADPLHLAPSTSATLMMALGDALAFALSEARSFTAESFARCHPAGSLGRKLSTVSACMRRDGDLRIANASETVRVVFANTRHGRRRTGAIMLLDEVGRLAGLFTDSDLARLFERRADADLDGPISAVMTRNPITIAPTARMAEAVELFSAKKISELPVVDEQGKPVGLLDITDVIGLLPAEKKQAEPTLRLVNKVPA